jgi:hypothetical protein
MAVMSSYDERMMGQYTGLHTKDNSKQQEFRRRQTSPWWNQIEGSKKATPLLGVAIGIHSKV